MAYKIYGDGDIYKDNKKFAEIGPDGTIWKDGKRYAKIYEDGIIYKDNKEIGKIHPDGDVYINHQKWGKIYFNEEKTTPKKKEDVFVEDSSPSYDEGGSSFGIPQIDIPDGDGLGGYVIAIIIIAILILAAIYLPVAATGQALIMWKTFTIDTLSYGFMGIVAAALLVGGTIFGFMTQLKKFKGGLILGLIMNTIIVTIAVLGGQFLVWGPMAFNSLGSDTFSIFSAFALMAAIPTLVCKGLAVLSNKFNWGLTNETVKPVSKPTVKKSISKPTVQKQVNQSKTTTTVNKSIATPKTSTSTTYNTSTSSQPKTRVVKGKTARNELAFLELSEIILDIKNGTFEGPSIWDLKLPAVVKIVLAVLVVIYTTLIALSITELTYIYADLLVIYTGIFVVCVIIQWITKMDYIKGLVLYAIVLTGLFVFGGISEYGSALSCFVYTISEEGGIVCLLVAYILVCFGLSYVGYAGKSASEIRRYKNLVDELEKVKQNSSYATTKTETCIFCGNVNRVPTSLTVGQATTCDKCKAVIRITK